MKQLTKEEMKQMQKEIDATRADLDKEPDVKVSCTWGDGPDVMVTFNNEVFILYENPHHLKNWSHGIVKKGSFDLTAEQARALAGDLLMAANSAEALDAQLEAYEDEHRENGECNCPSVNYIKGGQDGIKCLVCGGIVPFFGGKNDRNK